MPLLMICIHMCMLLNYTIIIFFIVKCAQTVYLQNDYVEEQHICISPDGFNTTEVMFEFCYEWILDITKPINARLASLGNCIET